MICCLPFFSCTCNLEKKVNPNDTTTTTSNPLADTTAVQPVIVPSFEISFPTDNKPLMQTSGDLDKDGVEEKVIVIDTDREGDLGTERDLLIFKVSDGQWKMWNRSTGAILPSQGGGVMGDPFEALSVTNGAIVIKHFGGSRQKWSTTHRFRFQNDDWQLIGQTIVNDDPCNSTETFDYNLSNGKVIYTKVLKSCDEGDKPRVLKTEKENFVSKPKLLPSMDNFYAEDIHVIVPKTGKCIPSSACYDYENKLGKTGEIDTPATNQLPEKLQELVGVYTLGGHDESWILLLKPFDGKLQAIYYEIDGMLPPRGEMESFLADNKSQTLKQFDVNFADLYFQSDLGSGKISKATEGKVITFLDKVSHIDDQLDLTRVNSLGFLVE